MAKTELSIEERRVVNAPANIVYTVLTSPADMVGWLSNEARCEARPGGVYDLRWYTGYAVHGKVKAAEKAHLLTVAWQGSADPGRQRSPLCWKRVAGQLRSPCGTPVLAGASGGRM